MTKKREPEPPPEIKIVQGQVSPRATVDVVDYLVELLDERDRARVVGLPWPTPGRSK